MNRDYPVLKNAEPFHFEGNKTGILVIHGFTGSTQSMLPLGEAYHQAGYTVCGPRLKGHGTHYEDMEQSSYEEWIASVEEGYAWLKERCETIFVTGLSMGGTLTLYMAERHPEVKAIVPINAAIDIPDMAGALKDPNQPRFLDSIGSDIKKTDVQELAYDKTPLASIKEIYTLMTHVKENLSQITCPALLFVSDEDHVVPPENAELIANQITSDEKSTIHLENSYHVATLDHDQQKIIDHSLSFFKKHLKA